MIVTHMGHAFLIVDAGGNRLLFDPLSFSWDSVNERQPYVASQLGKVDAVFLTHHHDDHLDIAKLLTFGPDVPIYVPSARTMSR